MPKFVFVPLPNVVREDWASNTDLDFPTTDEHLAMTNLVVDAESEEQAKAARMTISNLLAWELKEIIED